jgi:hypothetical protein
MFGVILLLVSAKITKNVKTVPMAHQQCPTTASTARNDVTFSSRPSAQIVWHAAIQEISPDCWYLVLEIKLPSASYSDTLGSAIGHAYSPNMEPYSQNIHARSFM